MTRFPPARIRVPFAAAAISLASLTLAGCNSTSLTDVTGSIRNGGPGLLSSASKISSDEPDLRQHSSKLADRYNSDPRNPQAAINYAQALRQNGQRAQAVAVLERAAIHNPNDRAIAGAYGRALADAGSLSQALEVLARAHTPDAPDWRILSVQGAVLDQLGRHQEARRYYTAALKIAPDEPSILSNLGLSYALAKELPRAETTLRKASEKNGKDLRIRQNLALVVGLQGRFKEAETIAKSDLPPEEAAANVAYLKQMLAEHQGGRKTASRDAG
jgi:Flp pilus assembly protein TadD